MPNVLGASLNSRLKRVVYGIDVNESGAVHLMEHLPKLYTNGEFETEFTGGVLDTECQEVYRRGEVSVLKARQAIEDRASKTQK